LKTSRSSTIDIEDLLEMLVQRVEEAITKTPEEEENCDESDGPDGFSQGEFSCFSNFIIFDLERAVFKELFNAHDEGL
jgi:hypothetical protein